MSERAVIAADPWRSLLHLAVLAPSPHNVQPWKVEILDDGRASLFMDRSRALPVADVTGSFLISAMTLFIEAFSVAAHAAGFELSYDLCDDLESLRAKITESDDLLPFALLRLARATTPISDFPVELLRKRRTSRVAYTAQPVDHAALSAATVELEGTGISYGQTSDPSTVRRILACNVHALFQDLNDSHYHGEIAPWFRCSRAEADSTRDGLSSESMNMSPIELAVAKNHPRLLAAPLLTHAFAAYYGRQLQCSTIGFLRGPFWQPPEALAAGHTLMRFWLGITAMGLSLHPLGNLVTNAQAAAKVDAILGASDIFFIFKLGYSRLVPASLRRPIEDILIA